MGSNDDERANGSPDLQGFTASAKQFSLGKRPLSTGNTGSEPEVQRVPGHTWTVHFPTNIHKQTFKKTHVFYQ
jgi:hypothetical protein